MPKRQFPVPFVILRLVKYVLSHISPAWLGWLENVKPLEPPNIVRSASPPLLSSQPPPPLLIKNERSLNNSNITFTLRWFDTVFSGPNLAFSIGVLSTSLSSDQCGNYTSTCKKIEVWLNVFFKVMGISMETINQKYENR